MDELGAVGNTKLSYKSFRAFTVLLIGIMALGARYAPEMYTISINQPFIVLTETKFSYRYIPVWARYSPTEGR